MHNKTNTINASLTHLSREDRLLLICARPDVGNCNNDEITNILNQPVRWDEVLEAAKWHALMPLLYKNLSRLHDITGIPDYVMDNLKAAYKANVARNMLLFSEFKTVIKALHQNGMEVIVLKGAALVSEMYGDIGLRQMSDIDLLIKKEDLPLAETTMSGAGYLASDDMPPEWLRDNFHHITYIHPDRNMPIELHWHISHQSQPGPTRIHDSDIIKQWWHNAETAEIFGQKVHVLCVEHMLIHLSLHFIKHRFLSRESEYKVCFISRGAVCQLADIVRTSSRYVEIIDWDRLKSDAKDYGLDELLYTTLYIVKAIAGNDQILHSKINDFLPDTFDSTIAKLMLNKIFVRESSFPPVTKLMIQSFGENSFIEGIKNIFSIMFPPSKVLAERYSLPDNSIKVYLCYLIRPFDVLFRHKGTISEVPRIKDDAALTRWICSQASTSSSDE